MLNKIEFDENGTVISVKGEDLEEKQNFEQYRFDENGVLIAIGDQKMEEDIQPIGSGLPGYAAPVEETTPVAPASNGFQFDANGNVIAAPTEQPAQPVPTTIQFDENGTVVSA